MSHAPVQGSCCLCPHMLSCHLLSAFRAARLGLGTRLWSHLRAGAPVLCYHTKRCSVAALPAVNCRTDSVAKPLFLINAGDPSLLLLCWWICSCSASFPICGFLTRPCWCRWCCLQDLSSGSGPRKAGGFWGLSSNAKHCLGDILMIRNSRMGSEFPFSSKWSCFF